MKHLNTFQSREASSDDRITANWHPPVLHAHMWGMSACLLTMITGSVQLRLRLQAIRQRHKHHAPKLYKAYLK